MNIAIVDDMQPDREKLENALMEYSAIHQLELEVRSFSGAEEFLSDYRQYQYTVLFLDIFMDGMTGIEAAQKVREIDDDVLLVFLTTSEEHRAEAFQCYASAYLIKSGDDEAVFRTMDHLFHLHTDREEKRFSFTSEKKDYKLRYADIVSLQSDGNYILITDLNGNSYRSRMQLSDAEKVLSQDSRFQPIIRGVIVNLDHVLQITNNTCRLRGNASYPVSALKSKALQQIWHNYNFEKLNREALWKGELS